MLAARFHDQRGLDSLRVEEIDRPTPGPNEVLVDVHAASVNAVDARVLEGEFSIPRPAILGGDLAGVVEETGAGVEGVEVGDRVFGAPMSLEPGGTFAEYAVVPAERLGRLPDAVAFEVGAAIASVGTTAYHGLVELGELVVGETCLIHGATGGVGHVAVQLAAAAGATVIATAGGPGLCERVESFGADVALEYTDDSLAEEIANSAPRGVDVILDHMLDTYLPLDLEVAATGGRIVAIQGDVPVAPGPPLRGKGVTIRGRSGEQLTDRRAFYEGTLGPLVADGIITPEIQATYALEDAMEAERVKAESRVVGKLVITPGAIGSQ